MSSINDDIKKIVSESSNLILTCNSISDKIELAVNEIVECLTKKNKIVIFGNGGSAADAQHIAAELIGRFQKERESFQVENGKLPLEGLIEWLGSKVETHPLGDFFQLRNLPVVVLRLRVLG